MFKEVTLTRGAWHWRIQEYVLGDVHFKVNFCPYFWLTIFSVFACAPLFCARSLYYYILKPGFKSAVWGVEAFDRFCNAAIIRVSKVICDPFYLYSVNNMTDERVVDAWEKSEDYYDELVKKDDYRYRQHPMWKEGRTGKIARKFQRRFDTWKELKGESWQEQLQRLQEENKKRRALRQKMREAQAEYAHQKHLKSLKRQQKVRDWQKNQMLWIIKITKVVAPIAALLVTGLVLYFLYSVAAWFYNLEYWGMWTRKFILYAGMCWDFIALVVPYLLALVAVCVVCFFVVRIIIALVKKCDIVLPRVKLPKLVWVGYTIAGMKKLVYPFYAIPRAIWFGIVGSFGFLWLFVKSMAKSQCPGIVWK